MKLRKQIAIKATSKAAVKDQLISIKPSDHSMKPVPCDFDPNKHEFRFVTKKGNNVKLGNIASWSTVYSAKPVFIKYMNGYVQGTCGKECSNKNGCEKACYVDRSYYKPCVPYGHAMNTIGLRTAREKVFADLDKQLTKSRTISMVRLNQSGDIESENEFLMWCRLAEKHPNVKFYIYTKQYKHVERPLLNGMVPNNFQINYSIWHKHGVEDFNRVKHIKNVSAFVYDDGELYMNIPKADYCAAYDDKGHMNHKITCAVCKKCLNGKTKVIGCKAH